MDNFTDDAVEWGDEKGMASVANSTLVDLFAEAARRAPEHIAVTLGHEHITYQVIDERSNQLAHYLRKQGVREETLVPICLNRSIEMIIGLLGILKAGGAFVPVDPDYPADRIQYMLADAGGPLVVTNAQTRRVLPESITTVSLDSEWATVAQEPVEPVSVPVLAHHLAYVIYTSGSTGRPKGVLIEHRSIVNYILNSIREYALGQRSQPSGSYLHLPLAFDASMTTIFVPLLTGKRIVVNALPPIEAFNNETLLQNGPFDFLKVTPAQLFLVDTASSDAIKTT